MRKTLFVLLIAILAFGALLAQADDASQAKQAEPQKQVRTEPAAATPQMPAESCTAPAANDLDFGITFLVSEPIVGAGELCGGVICGKGQYCCNPSCSTCVLIGMSCTQQSCN